MRHHNTLLHDLGKAMPRWRFEHLVRRTGADRRVRTLPSWSQFVALVYAQLAGITSLRELVAALASHANHAYHLGLGPIRRSTLAEANAKRPLALYEAVLATLLHQLQPRVAQGAREALRLVDATTIKLSALSGWARFSAHHHAAKLQVVYDPDAELPTFFEITRARVNDITVAKRLPIEDGATYVFDKGYYDFAFWAQLDARGCRFVTRRKVNTPLVVFATRPPSDPAIQADVVGRLPARLARNRQNPYAKPVRMVTVVRDDGQTLDLLTNDLAAEASAIAALYKGALAGRAVLPLGPAEPQDQALPRRQRACRQAADPHGADRLSAAPAGQGEVARSVLAASSGAPGEGQPDAQEDPSRPPPPTARPSPGRAAQPPASFGLRPCQSLNRTALGQAGHDAGESSVRASALAATMGALLGVPASILEQDHTLLPNS
jgi:hypothetical protein